MITTTTTEAGDRGAARAWLLMPLYAKWAHIVIQLAIVKHFSWDPCKNEALRAERGVSFEEIVFHIERGDILDILEHPNQERYEGQRVFVVRRGDYAYLVPFVEDQEYVFLKTIIPSRKATRKYLGKETEHDEA
jgi:uncharacterized DUF497 family protein